VKVDNISLSSLITPSWELFLYLPFGRLYPHGMCKPREVLHTWSNGRRVYLGLRRRWKCRDCEHTFTEGCNTKIKMLKRISYGLKNVEVYWGKMLLGFVPS